MDEGEQLQQVETLKGSGLQPPQRRGGMAQQGRRAPYPCVGLVVVKAFRRGVGGNPVRLVRTHHQHRRAR